ncbi:hypothetical protein PSTT_04300 [Puccinia striiformis]|uniref:SURF4-domain-containing protein n=1 Tax=Puccinia striiformis TaxID=27350 RepID=A0A2S4VSZ7_9BASI|nr:hypothetical protein PSTT_04300 [Puccinia striiformis]
MSNYLPVPLKEFDNSYHVADPNNTRLEPSTDGISSKIKSTIKKHSGTSKLSSNLSPSLSSLILINWLGSYWFYDDQDYHDWFVIGFLGINVFLMVLCSILIVFKKWSLFSFLGLIGVIISQGWVYDLITDTTFVCLNLSIMGALMLALSDTLVPGPSSSSSNLTNRRPVGMITGIMNDDQTLQEELVKKRQTYLQLTGRILLVVFFVGHAVMAYIELSSESFTILNLITVGFSVLACLLVTIGFKATWSAIFLVIVTSVVNVLSNDWWSKPKDHPERDFRRFDFFQALSVVGGMILFD